MATYKIAFSSMALKGKLEHGDPRWSEFNGSYENMDLETLDIANLIYTGHSFTTWHKNKWREQKNYLLGQHIGIDMDTEDERSTLEVLGKDKFISKHAALLYTTPSHTTNTPRSRVVFLLDTPIMQPSNYTLAATALIWLFGMADAKCKDPCRFFYGSPNCDMQFYTDNVLPLSKVKEIIASYQASGVQERQEQNRKATDACQDVGALVRWVERRRTGERNNALYWAANRAKDMFDAGIITDKKNAADDLIIAAIHSGLPEQEAMSTVKRVLQ